MESLFLCAEDVAILTGQVRPAAQRRALETMKIPFHIRPDGKPVVAKAVIKGLEEKAEKPRQEPNWAAIGG